MTNNTPEIETHDMPEVIQFLLGSAKLDGVWYGEKAPRNCLPYWWRNKLRDLFIHATPEKYCNGCESAPCQIEIQQKVNEAPPDGFMYVTGSELFQALGKSKEDSDSLERNVNAVMRRTDMAVVNSTNYQPVIDDGALAEAVEVYEQCDFVTVGEPDYCPPLEFIKRYVPALITHALKSQENPRCDCGDGFTEGAKCVNCLHVESLKSQEKPVEVTNKHRIKVLHEMGFGHEMINNAHIITYDGYKGFFINHTNLMCAMQRIPRAFTVLIHAAMKIHQQQR